MPTLREGLDELNGKLSEKARTNLIKIARKIANGFFEDGGEINITLGKGGGIRFVEYVQRDDGTSIKEEVE